MKRAIFSFGTSALFLSVLVTPVFAGVNASNGIYLGLGLVGGHYRPPEDAAFITSIVPIGLSWRPCAGYRINDYVALEAGYNYLAHAAGVSSLGPDEYELYAFDVAGKVIYPFESGFSIFSKFGVAVAHQYTFNQNTFFNIDYRKSVTRVLPLIGAGASYNFNQQAALEMSVSRAFGNGNIRNIDMVNVGLSYTFQ